MMTVVLTLVTLTGPNGQVIDINPDQVVSVRDKRDETGTFYHPEVRCILHTVDGKVVLVVEPCSTVLRKLKGQ